MNNTDLEIEREWFKLRHKLKEKFGNLPDLNAMLFLIGIQETGKLQDAFTKEEKQDLMHVGTCVLLSLEGYYKFSGRDSDGWPHWETLLPIPEFSIKEQELFLKRQLITYFKEV